MGNFSHVTSAEERQTLYDQMGYIIEEFTRNIICYYETFEGAFVQYQSKSGSLMFLLDSQLFDEIISEMYRKEFKKYFETKKNRQHLLDSIRNNYPREKFKSKCYNRLKYDQEKQEITYLLDDKNSVVKIDSQGFSVEKNRDVPFKTIVGMKDCAFPKRGVTVDECNMLLDSLFNVDGNSLLIMKVFLISCFFEIMHPILFLVGAPSTGKSRMSKILKRLTDNNVLELAAVSSKEEHQRTMLHCNRVVVLNNLTKISPVLNELICNTFDNAHYVGKELYTNDKPHIGNLDAILLISSINANLLEQMELLERSIVITPKKIENPESEISLDMYFARYADIIIGGICTVISRTLEILERDGIQKQTHRDRLIEFAQYGNAIAQALGYEEKEFDLAFKNIRQKGLMTMARNIPEIELLLGFFSEEVNTRISGTPTSVYQTICDYHGIPDEKRQKNIALFTGVLNQNETLLERLGIKVSSKKQGKQRLLEICRFFPIDDFGIIGAAGDALNIPFNNRIKDIRNSVSGVSSNQKPIPNFINDSNSVPEIHIPARSLFNDDDDDISMTSL